ncbi:STAM-binding protein-like [Centruroides sculpturatus]|uniref:STAM-binding protein-like n=1 Tax=Centruroides sculpturatus TaxID=218467 RepID=UPI000C6C8D04|nr:STAM-binding protein-like [Centruroides sculpturatus]
MVMKNNYFQYDKKFYTQTEGIPMGTCIGPKLAEITIIQIDEKIKNIEGIEFYNSLLKIKKMPSVRDHKDAVTNPEIRVRSLTAIGSAVEVDPNIPPRRYFRSGTEMIRMAKVYLEEGNFENAYILYSKILAQCLGEVLKVFNNNAYGLTLELDQESRTEVRLFVEKLPKHPEYQNVGTIDKANTKQKLKEIFTIAEKLKSKLLEKYSREYEEWLKEKKKEEEEEERERERLLLEEEKRRNEEARKSALGKQNEPKFTDWDRPLLNNTSRNTYDLVVSPSEFSDLRTESSLKDYPTNTFTTIDDNSTLISPTFSYLDSSKVGDGKELFVEKLPKHPEYQNVGTIDKANTKQKLKEIFTIAEKLKSKLLEKYSREYEEWLKEKKKEEEEEERERERLLLEEEKRRNEEARKSALGKQNEPKFTDWDRPLLNNTSRNTYDLVVSPSEFSDLRTESSLKDYPTNTFTTIDDNSTLISPTFSYLDSSKVGDGKELLTVTTPTVDRSTKPRSLLSPVPESQNISGLRTVIVPRNLIDQFLHLAEQNTICNIETCGILAGKLSYSKFTVTHLLIPKQTGSADSCTTGSEEELFTYQDKHDLITLGWIHTHPTQTAFMSSVDLHSHCSYQLMMPEAVAIVCSPKYQETGMFSLTQDYGLDYIANCRESGFHPHPKEPPLYEECSHVELSERTKAIVVDLRK